MQIDAGKPINEVFEDVQGIFSLLHEKVRNFSASYTRHLKEMSLCTSAFLFFVYLFLLCPVRFEST